MSFSAWELLDADPFAGVKKYIRSSGDDHGTVEVRYECDNDPVIERNKALQNEDFNRRADLWHAASIPVGVMYEWLAKYGINAWNPAHMDAVKKLLNSSDYRYLKVKHIIL